MQSSQNITIIKLELFSFAVLSTAKEIIFNSAAFASQAKRAVKQYKKYVIELTNQSTKCSANAQWNWRNKTKHRKIRCRL